MQDLLISRTQSGATHLKILDRSFQTVIRRHVDLGEGVSLPVLEPEHDKSDDAAGDATPIRYADQVLGHLRVDPTEASGDAAVRLADRIALLYKRLEARDVTVRAFGRSECLLGQSPALARLEREIERSSQWDLPVLLLGEFGCQQRAIAALIHVAGRRASGPLIPFACAGRDPEAVRSELPAALSAAAGGTLLLEGLDRLGHASGEIVARSLRRAQCADVRSSATGVRFVSTIPVSHDESPSEIVECDELLAAVDVVRIHVPPLRARPEDVDAIVLDVAERLGVAGDPMIDRAVRDRLRSYRWPGNVAELERTAARLLALKGPGPVSMDDLIRLAPELVARRPRGSRRQRRAVPPPSIEELARDVLAGEVDRIGDLHPALQGAVAHLGSHFEEEISAAALADAAHVSMSHLAHLFKKELDMTFKQLLSQIRVERAKSLLQSDRELRITDVALDVGFGDLSHFLKTFRRLVGHSPKEYRELRDDDVVPLGPGVMDRAAS